MKFNQKLIKQLAAGEIILKNEPKNPETALEIIVATGKSRTWFDGQSPYYYKETSGMMYGCDRLDLLPKLPIVPIADFLLPEPRFKKGDKVRVKDQKYDVWVILSSKQHPETGNWAYLLESGMYNMNVSEGLLELVTEPEYVVGQQYEFFNGCVWIKGEFVAAVDGKTKRYFLGILGNNTEEGMFQDIRQIQPKEVTRWINMSQSGNQVGKKCFESEMEACQHAPQSQNVFQVKLTGTYKI